MADPADSFVSELMEKTYFDPSNPLQFKSPNSSNVYTVIGLRPKEGEKDQMIGLNMEIDQHRLEIRFAVFCDSDPGLQVFSTRMKIKNFTKLPISPEPETRKGCPLNKISMQVFEVGTKATAAEVFDALEKDDGWDKIGSWIAAAMKAEKFFLAPKTEGELVGMLPGVLMNSGQPPKPAIIYPEPIKKAEEKKAEEKKKSKPTVQVSASHDNEGDDNDD